MVKFYIMNKHVHLHHFLNVVAPLKDPVCTVEHHIVSNVVTIAIRMFYCLKTLAYDTKKHMSTAQQNCSNQSDATASRMTQQAQIVSRQSHSQAPYSV